MVNKREEILVLLKDAITLSKFQDVKLLQADLEGLIVSYKDEPYFLKITRCQWDKLERIERAQK